MIRRSWMRAPLHACAALILLACYVPSVGATVPIDSIGFDFSPLIDESARYPARFAVDIAHPVSASNQGQWTDNGLTSTWKYTIRIDTAVSMSFHASAATLPPSAVLTVAGASSTGSTYHARDVNRGGLWARPLPGGTLFLSLTVSDTERSAVRLQIAGFQAGYRSLGGTVPDHAHYRRLMAAVAQTSSCTENYSCHATAAKQGPAHATVAVLVGNTVQCTGTLLNDTGSDGAPYVLTARHCENDILGGGDPGAAASVTVYWDATTPCGAMLGSIYDGNSVTQTGATTVVEQQDAWLIRLDSAPAASDAYFSGWDATGGTFSGGYSVHHALGYDKQYLGWYGQPILQTIPGTTLNLGYASTFWGVVNQVGSVGPGASGGALFDPDNNAVGSLTSAVKGPDSSGICPAAPPAVPSASTLTAQYTALASVWSSIADTTSTTGAATLQSALDGAKSGQLLMGGIGFLPVTLTVNQDSSVPTGQAVTLTWSAPGAQSCLATGGLSGDGWAGTQGAAGTYQLTEQSGGHVSYGLICKASGLAGASTVVVSWVLAPPFVGITGVSTTTLAAGGTVQLQWSANTQPCTASGGSSGDGWAGPKATSGSQNVVALTLGSITYTLTCGTEGRIGTAQFTITTVAPSVSSILTDANNMRVGQPADMSWTDGGLCTASGGAAGDGWAGTVFTAAGSATVTETIAGTYTYTVTCSGAGLSASSSLSLTFTNAAPSVTLTPTPAQAEIYTDAGAYNSTIANLNVSSNVRPCTITYVGPGNVHGKINVLQGVFPSVSGQDSEGVAGAYVYTVTCGTGSNQQQSSATVTWFTNQPAVTLSAANPWPLGFPSSVSWSSNVYPCTGTGGTAGDGWAGSKAGPSGGQAVTESTLGSETFGITCGSGTQIVQAQAATTVITPTVSISASASTVAPGQVSVITWTANFEPCTSSISPGSAGGWGTLLNMTGGFLAGGNVPGTYTYSINCDGAQASTPVTFTGPTPTATLSASASSVTLETPVTLTWTSPVNSSCTAAGGASGDGWSGTYGYTGSITVTSSVTRTVTYTILCVDQWDQLQTQTQVTYTAIAATAPSTPTPSVTLTASSASEVVGSEVTLSWNSQNASACAASGGGNADGWTGNLALSGTMAITEPTAGSFGYDIRCTGAPPAATANAKVEFTGLTVTSSSGTSSKGGGGGAIDPLCLLMLFLLVFGRAYIYMLSQRTVLVPICWSRLRRQ